MRLFQEGCLTAGVEKSRHKHPPLFVTEKAFPTVSTPFHASHSTHLPTCNSSCKLVSWGSYGVCKHFHLTTIHIKAKFTLDWPAVRQQAARLTCHLSLTRFADS